MSWCAARRRTMRDHSAAWNRMRDNGIAAFPGNGPKGQMRGLWLDRDSGLSGEGTRQIDAWRCAGPRVTTVWRGPDQEAMGSA